MSGLNEVLEHEESHVVRVLTQKIDLKDLRSLNGFCCFQRKGIQVDARAKLQKAFPKTHEMLVTQLAPEGLYAIHEHGLDGQP
jgi:hypothetical protein